jgi:hypothetical protein
MEKLTNSQKLFEEVEGWLGKSCVWSKMMPEIEAIDQMGWNDEGRHIMRRVLPDKPDGRWVKTRIEQAVNAQGHAVVILGLWREDHLTELFKPGESSKAVLDSGQPVLLYYGNDTETEKSSPWRATLQLPAEKIYEPAGGRLAQLIEDGPGLVDFMETVTPNRVPPQSPWAGSRILSAVPYLAVKRMLEQLERFKGAGVYDQWSEIVYSTLLGESASDDWWLGKGLAAALSHSRLPAKINLPQSIRLILPDMLQDPEGRWCRALALTLVKPEDCRVDLDFWKWPGMDAYGPVHLDWQEPALVMWAYAEGDADAAILAGKTGMDTGAAPESVQLWNLLKTDPEPIGDLIAEQIMRLPPIGKIWRRRSTSWAEYWRSLLRLGLGARLAYEANPHWLEPSLQTRRARADKEALWTPNWLGREVPIEYADGKLLPVHVTQGVSRLLPGRMQYATGAWKMSATRGMQWQKPKLQKVSRPKEIQQEPKPGKEGGASQMSLF